MLTTLTFCYDREYSLSQLHIPLCATLTTTVVSGITSDLPNNFSIEHVIRPTMFLHTGMLSTSQGEMYWTCMWQCWPNPSVMMKLTLMIGLVIWKGLPIGKIGNNNPDAICWLFMVGERYSYKTMEFGESN